MRYDSATRLPLMPPMQPLPAAQAADASLAPDFISDDALKLYYAGDFCSHRAPGVEAAALSAVEITLPPPCRLRLSLPVLSQA